MTLNPVEARAALRQVAFHPSAATSPVLQGVTHGFRGVGQAPIAVHAVQQVHGIAVATATATQAMDRPIAEADAVVTSERGVRIGVKTADCLPLLIVDEAHTVAAAVHAGWRGLTQGIVAQTLARVALGAPLGTLKVAIGPAIGRERYEVGDEVIDALFGAPLGLSAGASALCVAKGRGDRWHADLPLAAALTLIAHGVPPTRIAVMQACTFSMPQWHSFRREGRGAGSNWSWIEL